MHDWLSRLGSTLPSSKLNIDTTNLSLFREGAVMPGNKGLTLIMLGRESLHASDDPKELGLSHAHAFRQSYFGRWPRPVLCFTGYGITVWLSIIFLPTHPDQAITRPHLPQLNMSDPLQSPEAAEEHPYMSLETWRGPEQTWPRDGAALDHLEEREDPYIASHVWTCSDHKVETFGGSVTGDVAQNRLREFLLRNTGAWTKSTETRKARWSESVIQPCI
jgi:hypothetical protein